MNQPLVVGVDGSEPSLRAVDWAADEAALRRAPLRIVYASLWERYEGPALAREVGGSSGRVAAEDILAAAAQRALRHHAELPVTTADMLEEPERALVREARGASAVVVGSRGRSGLADLLLGSVSLTVAAQADCPVVVIRGNHSNRAVGGGRDHIVVGAADGPTAAVRFACEEAKRRGPRWKRYGHGGVPCTRRSTTPCSRVSPSACTRSGRPRNWRPPSPTLLRRFDCGGARWRAPPAGSSWPPPETPASSSSADGVPAASGPVSDGSPTRSCTTPAAPSWSCPTWSEGGGSGWTGVRTGRLRDRTRAPPPCPMPCRSPGEVLLRAKPFRRARLARPVPCGVRRITRRACCGVVSASLRRGAVR